MMQEVCQHFSSSSFAIGRGMYTKPASKRCIMGCPMALFLSLVLNESIHFYVQHTLHSLIWKRIFLIRAGRMEMKWVLLNTVEKKLHHKCVI